MSHVALFLLGSPRIERDGEPVKVDTRKAIALAAYLALSDASHTRDALAALLWPESDQARARANLRRTLSTLRKALGREWLQGGQDSLTLKRETGFWLDVDHFERRLAECQAHGHAADDVCPACLAPLTEAVELYRDGFMAGFTLRDSLGFDEWQFHHSENLRCELAGALEKLSRWHSTQGEVTPAIAFARRWLAIDPLHEPSHRRLMHLYARAGQRGAALRQYQKCVQVLERELGVAPQEETTRLFHTLQDDQSPLLPAPPRPAYRHNLPHQSTPFVGRQKELAEIERLIEGAACRLLTLVGPGGIGKTQLALRAAAESIEAFPDGVFFVPLAPLSAADALVPAIADALAFSPHGPQDLKRQLLSYLGEKALLLVMDNLEHLLDGAELLTEILHHAPEVRILVTSRERLNLQGEWVLQVQGLPFPQAGENDQIEGYSAVLLFQQSARRVYPGFQLQQEKTCVARVCRLVEGMPLAIELAAAWARAIPCAEIAREIERDLGFLATPLRDVPERHRSLRAVFDHSWNLLLREEKSVFKKLSVFRGGFRRPAATQVARASLPILAGLVDKSFLRRSPSGRYEVLEVLRQYAQEQLRQSPQEEGETRARHCEYYAGFLHRRESHLKGAGQKEALEEIGAEIDNVRSAWEWAVTHEKTDTIGKSLLSLSLFYEMRARLQEGEAVFEKAVAGLGGVQAALDAPTEKALLLGRLFAHQGWRCYGLARFEKAQELLQTSLSILRRLRARREMGLPLGILGLVAVRLGRYAEAEQLFQQRLTIHQQSGDRWDLANCLNDLGVLAWLQEDYAEAKRLFQQGLTICQELGDRYGMAMRATNMGLAAEQLGQHEEAQHLHRQSLVLSKEIDNRWQTASSSNNLGFTLCALGEHPAARECFQEALEIAADITAVQLVLEALVGIATLLIREGEKKSAAELAAHVFFYPEVYQEVKDRAAQTLSELASQLSPETLAEAQQRGRASKSEHYVRLYGAGQTQFGTRTNVDEH